MTIRSLSISRLLGAVSWVVLAGAPLSAIAASDGPAQGARLCGLPMVPVIPWLPASTGPDRPWPPSSD